MSTVTVWPETAASRQGPQPVSYCRSSSCTASEPVNATVRARPPSISVTEISDASGMAFAASPATRSSTAPRGWSPSTTLLSSANTEDGSTGFAAGVVGWTIAKAPHLMGKRVVRQIHRRGPRIRILDLAQTRQKELRGLAGEPRLPGQRPALLPGGQHLDLTSAPGALVPNARQPS